MDGQKKRLFLVFDQQCPLLLRFLFSCPGACAADVHPERAGLFLLWSRFCDSMGNLYRYGRLRRVEVWPPCHSAYYGSLPVCTETGTYVRRGDRGMGAGIPRLCPPGYPERERHNRHPAADEFLSCHFGLIGGVIMIFYPLKDSFMAQIETELAARKR